MVKDADPSEELDDQKKIAVLEVIRNSPRSSKALKKRIDDLRGAF